MTNDLRSGTCSLIPRLSAVALPIDVSEILELAAADVVIDGAGAGMGAIHVEEFEVFDTDGRTRCAPLLVAAAAWGRRQPAALAAHDAFTTALAFPRVLTDDRLEELECVPASDMAIEAIIRAPLIAALTVSDFSSKPLRLPPFAWDDQRRRAGASVKDLRHLARFQAEFRSRIPSAEPETSLVDYLPSRS